MTSSGLAATVGSSGFAASVASRGFAAMCTVARCGLAAIVGSCRVEGCWEVAGVHCIGLLSCTGWFAHLLLMGMPIAPDYI